ncbi:MAG: hypothetical protein RJB39_43 [Candidatus Parcubacteria bacterium]|jgi:peptidoglycan hydrolase-like protein with peptidoglycan-binding domain
MKKSISAAIFALALTVSVTASAQGFMFNKSLQLGMRGADVTALQNYLADAGFFNVAATGYFGSVTKRAVVAFQLANNLPGTGFVGVLTRGVLNSSPVATTPTPGATCPTGFTCTATTPTSPTLVGSEGFAEVRVSPVVTNNPNVQTNIDVPVYAVEFKAKQSDILVERINLLVAVTQAGSLENPATLVNKVTIKDGSTVIASVPVNSSSFSKDTSVTPNQYYLQIAGLGVKVSKDTLKTLTVTFDTNSIDSDRVVTVGVYGQSGIRTVDGRGISSYNALSDTRVHTFKKPGTSQSSVRSDAVTVYSMNYRVSRTGNGAEKVLTSTFAVKSETGRSKITAVKVSIATTSTYTNSSTLPSNVYLYDGSTLIDARSVTSLASPATVTFDLNNYSVYVEQDTTKTFTIRADFPSNTATGTTVSTAVTEVTYEKPNGSSETQTGLNIAGPYHYLAPVVPQFGKVSSSATVIKNGANAQPTGIEAKFVATVTAQGGPINTGTLQAVIQLVNVNSGAVASTSTTTAVVESGLATFPEGAVKNAEFTAFFGTTSIPSTGVYKAVIAKVLWTPTGGSQVAQTQGFELMDTASVTY